MRKKTARKQHHNSRALPFALFIGALIVLLIIAAVGIKVFILFQHSTFDGKHQFSLEIEEATSTRFVVFNPEDNSIHTLLLVGNTPSNVGSSFGIPIDGVIKSDDDIATAGELTKKLLLERKALRATTTIIDGINLFVFSHTADGDKYFAKNMSTSASTSEQDAILSKVFTDTSLYKEGQSIAIINASGISGKGSEVGKLLMHLGANVVSINSAQEDSKKSQIEYVGDMSYTLSRMQELFHFPIVHLSTPAVSDITIVLGEDVK